MPQPPALFPALDLPETGAVVEVLDLACAAGVQRGGEPAGAVGAAEAQLRADLGLRISNFRLNFQDDLFSSRQLRTRWFRAVLVQRMRPSYVRACSFVGACCHPEAKRRICASSCERQVPHSKRSEGPRQYRGPVLHAHTLAALPGRTMASAVTHALYTFGLVPLRERNLDSVLRGRETPNTQSFTSRSMTCKRIDARG